MPIGNMSMLGELRLDVAFQPIVRLSTGEVFGYEALMRGVRPAGEVVPTELLLDGARTLNIIHNIEQAVHRRALDVQEMLFPEKLLFLNIDLSSYNEHPESYQRLYGDSSGLAIELTETNGRDLLNFASWARKSPVQLALDDFGSSLSNLDRILVLEPSFIKLDGTFVHHVERDELRQQLVRATLELSRFTDTTLIAECVETEAEASFLRSVGVPFAQGYLFGRPQRSSVFRTNSAVHEDNRS